MLLMVELLLLAAFAAAVHAPKTPLGKTLRHALIDVPAEALSRATPLKVITGLIVFLILVAFVISGPEWIAIMGFGDLTAFLDITVIAILFGTASRLKYAVVKAIHLNRSVAPCVVAGFNRIGGRGRRLRRRKPNFPPSIDDVEPQLEWALA